MIAKITKHIKRSVTAGDGRNLVVALEPTEPPSVSVKLHGQLKKRSVTVEALHDMLGPSEDAAAPVTAPPGTPFSLEEVHARLLVFATDGSREQYNAKALLSRVLTSLRPTEAEAVPADETEDDDDNEGGDED